jgi:hypothetical protein
MALASYGDLKSAISSWMFDRTDLDGQAGDFVSLCEGDLNRVLRTRNQLDKATLTLDTDASADLPDDYLEFRQVTALTTPRRILSEVAPSYRDQVYPFRSGGLPSVFTIDGSTMTVLPSTTSSIELEYFAKIAALSEDEPSNWLLEKFPNIYLYGSLKHAAVFMGDNDRMQSCGAMFAGLLDALVKDERAALWSRGQMRSAGVTP